MSVVTFRSIFQSQFECRKPRMALVCAMCGVIGAGGWQLQAQTPDAVVGTSGSIEQTVRPFVERHCLKCHSGGYAAAMTSIQLLPLLASRDTLTSRRREWETVAYVLQARSEEHT